MEILKKFELNQNENVIQEVHHHFGIIIPHLVVSALILVLDFFMLAFLFMQGWWGVILFLTIIAVIVFYLLRLMFLFKKNKFLITNQRILDFEQAGFFENFINEMYLKDIKEVEVQKKGIGAYLWHYGDIRLFLINEIAPIELYKISDPKKIQDIIHRLINGGFSQTKDERLDDPVKFIMAEVELLDFEQKMLLIEQIKKKITTETGDS